MMSLWCHNGNDVSMMLYWQLLGYVCNIVAKSWKGQDRRVQQIYWIIQSMSYIMPVIKCMKKYYDIWYVLILLVNVMFIFAWRRGLLLDFTWGQEGGTRWTEWIVGYLWGPTRGGSRRLPPCIPLFQGAKDCIHPFYRGRIPHLQRLKGPTCIHHAP